MIIYSLYVLMKYIASDVEQSGKEYISYILYHLTRVLKIRLKQHTANNTLPSIET